MPKYSVHFLYFLCFLCLGFNTACTKTTLTVQSDYITQQSLASYYVRTPDPMLDNPPLGQRLIVNWSLPRQYLQYENLHLELTVRFRNGTEAVELIYPKQLTGTYVYAVINEDFFEKNGILTFKVDVIGGDCILQQWNHQLWTTLLHIGEADCDEDDEDLVEDCIDIESEIML